MPRHDINYWGYAPVSFFAPHQRLQLAAGCAGSSGRISGHGEGTAPAGIEVILDVVFNHTAEGDDRGPTLSFRGLDNSTYYILEDGGSRYANYSGAGNTLNANHPVVRRMIVDSLRYWVEEMHVDGFRFDLASILARDSSGHPMSIRRCCGISNPIRQWQARSSSPKPGMPPVSIRWAALSATVGRNGTAVFATTFASFFRGEPGSVTRLADRLVGSPEIYGHKQREAEQSVNFVTCHDGFTLNDLVSYNQKHNEANGEDNRDGANDNRSWNCGAEGPTDDPARGSTAQSPSEEFSYRHVAFAGLAHDPDGG